MTFSNIMPGLRVAHNGVWELVFSVRNKVLAKLGGLFQDDQD